MPMHNFGNGFDHGFGERGFGMMQPGRGVGFFSPLMFILRIAFWGLVLWAIYMLAMRSGWQLTRATQTNETQPKAADTEERTTEN
jgi:hypothetical protein